MCKAFLPSSGISLLTFTAAFDTVKGTPHFYVYTVKLCCTVWQHRLSPRDRFSVCLYRCITSPNQKRAVSNSLALQCVSCIALRLWRLISIIFHCKLVTLPILFMNFDTVFISSMLKFCCTFLIKIIRCFCGFHIWVLDLLWYLIVIFR